MPATVIVNNLTVVHRKSGGVAMAMPDVCKTPTPGGPVPVPYANAARSENTSKGSKSVKADSSSLMLRSSNFSTSSGDEPGTLGGIVSGKSRGKAYPRSYSMDVKVEGDNVFRLSDLMMQNAGSPGNGVGGLGQPNLVASGAAPDHGKLVAFRWVDHSVCCGDKATLMLQATGLDGPVVTPVVIALHDNPKIVLDQQHVETINGQVYHPWITYRRQYRKKVGAGASQHILDGETRSDNKLEIRAPADARETVAFKRYGIAYEWRDQPTPNWYPTSKRFGWDVCYQIESRDGTLIVTRKLQYDAGPGAHASPRARKRWKQEIEAVWDRRFRLHRKGCLRKNQCDCGWNSGCCVYMLRIRAEFGPGHGTVKLIDGAPQARDEDDFWRSHTWWTKQGYGGNTVRAHEFGHLIGMYDEYGNGGCDYSGKDIYHPNSVMAWGAEVHPRHVMEFAKWFASRAASTVGGLQITTNK